MHFYANYVIYYANSARNLHTNFTPVLLILQAGCDILPADKKSRTERGSERMDQGAERLIQAITDFIFAEDEPENSDIILIPGAMSPGHALRAAELYREGYAPLVLPSGRWSKGAGRVKALSPENEARYPGPYDTEWQFLHRVLTEAGVPENAVLKEDQATFTWENALLSRLKTDEAGLVIRRAILCVKPYHARRALLYYQAAFPDTRFFICPDKCASVTRDNWYLTSRGREKVMSEVLRMGGQVKEQLELLLSYSKN